MDLSIWSYGNGILSPDYRVCATVDREACMSSERPVFLVLFSAQQRVGPGNIACMMICRIHGSRS
jgi:hypothetical protein